MNDFIFYNPDKVYIGKNQIEVFGVEKMQM